MGRRFEHLLKRRYQSSSNFDLRLQQTWKKQADASAVRIQRLFRSYSLRLASDQERLCKTVLFRRRKAALAIQGFWKERKRHEREEMELLVKLNLPWFLVIHRVCM